ncbi:hypothetical protein [Kamptonema formosum]|uniref:hypothetical protein n=1 Tax=Kamptonema formosum TaxID=331992 RepID=UPI000378ED29|nr:hypothetical protein [Oscillatoria sp. PCC 10802]
MIQSKRASTAQNAEYRWKDLSRMSARWNVTEAIRLQPVSGVSCQVAVPAAHAGIWLKVFQFPLAPPKLRS